MPTLDLLAVHTVEDYAKRPAAEWGNEYSAFLRQHGVAHLTASVLLPRRDLMVRVVNLPGVQPKCPISSPRCSTTASA